MVDSSIKEKYSRYTQGGETDVYTNRLGWWEREKIPTADDDIPFTLTARYALRPDLVANDVYGKVNLMWLVLAYNNILDVNTEFTKGTKITLPSPQRVFFDLVTKPNNGNFIS